jgi:hypothetical protein
LLFILPIFVFLPYPAHSGFPCHVCHFGLGREKKRAVARFLPHIFVAWVSVANQKSVGLA